jgi:hypothetical protein
MQDTLLLRQERKGLLAEMVLGQTTIQVTNAFRLSVLGERGNLVGPPRPDGHVTNAFRLSVLGEPPCASHLARRGTPVTNAFRLSVLGELYAVKEENKRRNVTNAFRLSVLGEQRGGNR